MTLSLSCRHPVLYGLRPTLRGGPLTPGKAINALRTSDEETLEAFAKRLGVSMQHLSDVEKGRRRVSVERAAKWVVDGARSSRCGVREACAPGGARRSGDQA